LEMSVGVRDRSSRMYSQLLRAMDEVTQKRIAALMGVSESTLSALKNDSLERVCMVATICGFRLVSIDEETFDADEISAMRTLAQRGLQRVAPVRGEG
jgi:transcriptional regulator with XRE-family HTH domain